MQRRLPRRGDGLLVREVTPREPESLFTNSTAVHQPAAPRPPIRSGILTTMCEGSGTIISRRI